MLSLVQDTPTILINCHSFCSLNNLENFSLARSVIKEKKTLKSFYTVEIIDKFWKTATNPLFDKLSDIAIKHLKK